MHGSSKPKRYMIWQVGFFPVALNFVFLRFSCWTRKLCRSFSGGKLLHALFLQTDEKCYIILIIFLDVPESQTTWGWAVMRYIEMKNSISSSNSIILKKYFENLQRSGWAWYTFKWSKTTKLNENLDFYFWLREANSTVERKKNYIGDFSVTIHTNRACKSVSRPVYFVYSEEDPLSNPDLLLFDC